MNARNWTIEQKERLMELYPDRTISIQRVADELGRTVASIKQMRALLGIKRGNGGFCDDSIFSRETPEVAYWAGFLMADGNIASDDLTPRIRLMLSNKDTDHVETFRSFIGCSNNMGMYENAASISVTSRTMVSDLRRWGVIPNKTYVGQIPNDIPDHLMPHYLRGLFDGDGGIYIYPRNKTGAIWDVRLCNNGTVISQVRSIIDHHIGIDAKVYDATERDTKILSVTRKPEVRSLVEWLGYAGNGPALARKRAKANIIIATDPSLFDMRKKPPPCVSL